MSLIKKFIKSVETAANLIGAIIKGILVIIILIGASGLVIYLIFGGG